MSSPPVLPNTLSETLLLHLEPLTPSSFAPFGTAISAPFAASLTTPPTTIPKPMHATHQAKAVFANQNSALKTSPISTIENRYPETPVSKPQMSMFSCFPRNLSGIGIEQGESPEDRGAVMGNSRFRFRVSILERHPYTTQTFCPMALDRSNQSTLFVVVVAPSLPTSTSATTSTGKGSSTVQVQNPPDLSRIGAFFGSGDQAVTYNTGTWHAPMVVLGERRLDFVVTQFVNGVAEDDCQEVLLGANVVAVKLASLSLRFKRNDHQASRDGGVGAKL